MMDYTHAVVGAAGAVGLALSAGVTTPEVYIVASVAGTLGGVAIDADVKDNTSNPKITDAGRTRLACIGMIALGAILDFIFKTDIIKEIVSRQYTAIGGAVVFLVLMVVGHFTDHRTLTHSLLFTIVTTGCIYCIFPNAASYYLTGCVLHLVLDMLNNKVSNHGMNHGIWLLYPLKIGKGIALGLCKSDREANKAFYFLGLALFAVSTVYYVMQISSIKQSIAPIAILVYTVVVMHFVRVKSEREIRHIMHIHREL